MAKYDLKDPELFDKMSKDMDKLTPMYDDLEDIMTENWSDFNKMADETKKYFDEHPGVDNV